MTLFEKKRYVIKLVREWFPNTPIYFDEYLEDNFAGLTQFDHEKSVVHFAFCESELICITDEQVRDLTLHEIAHGLNVSLEGDGHDDKWLKLFHLIGGKNCWGSMWHGYYRDNK